MFWQSWLRTSTWQPGSKAIATVGRGLSGCRGSLGVTVFIHLGRIAPGLSVSGNLSIHLSRSLTVQNRPEGWLLGNGHKLSHSVKAGASEVAHAPAMVFTLFGSEISPEVEKSIKRAMVRGLIAF